MLSPGEMLSELAVYAYCGLWAAPSQLSSWKSLAMLRPGVGGLFVNFDGLLAGIPKVLVLLGGAGTGGGVSPVPVGFRAAGKCL